MLVFGRISLIIRISPYNTYGHGHHTAKASGLRSACECFFQVLDSSDFRNKTCYKNTFGSTHFTHRLLKTCKKATYLDVSSIVVYSKRFLSGI